MNWKPAGITPRTLYFSPFRVMSRPTISGSRPKRRCHSPWLSTATRFAPGRSSSGPNTRPSLGAMPSSGKKEAVTRRPSTFSGSPPPPVRTKADWPTAANPTKAWFWSRRAA